MNIKLIAISLILAFSVTACSDDEQVGTLEKAGKQADQRIDKATELMNEKMQGVSDKMDNRSNEIDKALDNKNN